MTTTITFFHSPVELRKYAQPLRWTLTLTDGGSRSEIRRQYRRLRHNGVSSGIARDTIFTIANEVAPHSLQASI